MDISRVKQRLKTETVLIRFREVFTSWNYLVVSSSKDETTYEIASTELELT